MRRRRLLHNGKTWLASFTAIIFNTTRLHRIRRDYRSAALQLVHNTPLSVAAARMASACTSPRATETTPRGSTPSYEAPPYAWRTEFTSAADEERACTSMSIMSAPSAAPAPHSVLSAPRQRGSASGTSFDQRARDSCCEGNKLEQRPHSTRKRLQHNNRLPPLLPPIAVPA